MKPSVCFPGLDLSQYLLKVTGLPDGEYNISIDGKLVLQLQSPLNQAWRKASKEKDAEKVAAAQAAIEACEKELQALIQPVPVKVEIGR